MPSRHVVKEDIADGIYHAYNRGIARRSIFTDQHDYRRFKLLMRLACERETAVTMLAFSLMPNHFHFLLRQTEAGAMGRWFQRLSVGYVMYFNRRHHRKGPLMQGRYRADRIVGPGRLMEVSRYIHLNPQRARLGWEQYQHSSLGVYIAGQTGDTFVNPALVLELFDHPSDYLEYLSKAKVRPRT